MSKRIGDLLIEKGLIQSSQIPEILSFGQKTGIKFGEAGIALGLYSQKDLTRALGVSTRADFFYLEPQYFPVVTRELFPVAKLMEWGALPIGYKKVQGIFRASRKLNLGMLNPGRQEVIREVLALPHPEPLAGVQAFLVVPDQFVTILAQVYHVSTGELESTPRTQLDPTLALYLEG